MGLLGAEGREKIREREKWVKSEMRKGFKS